MWYKNVNIDVDELERDYGSWVLSQYIKRRDYTKWYISNNYKVFMKTIKGIEGYKMELAKSLGRYGSYLLPMIDAINEDNSIDLVLFKERNAIPDSQMSRVIASYKENSVLRKVWHTFYLNPLVAFSGRDIRDDLWDLFKDELKKVNIIVK